MLYLTFCHRLRRKKKKKCYFKRCGMISVRFRINIVFKCILHSAENTVGTRRTGTSISYLADADADALTYTLLP